MPSTGFRVTIAFRGASWYNRMRQKIESVGFAQVFDAIIDRWMQHNQAKFDLAEGKQGVGVTFPGTDVFWRPLSELYEARKTAEGFDDHLMVRWGDTIESLTERDDSAFFEEIGPRAARFGSTVPQAIINQDTGKRPVMFLDPDDELMIGEMFTAFMGEQPPFVAFQPSDSQRMDTEYAGVMAA